MHISNSTLLALILTSLISFWLGMISHILTMPVRFC